MFLSPMDVHVNRTPVGGHRPPGGVSSGQVPAGLQERGRRAERVDGGLARSPRRPRRRPADRRDAGAADRLPVERRRSSVSGQRFGVMKFGSRIDLFIPRSATIHVKAGDKVVGGETTLATLAQ